MPSRRDFIKSSSIIIAGLSFPQINLYSSFSPDKFQSKRPEIKNRKFISDAIEAKIAEMKKIIKDEELIWLFENCFPNTLDTTVTYRTINGRPDTFVITGDINAMWLRDSSAQVWPYLPFTKDDQKLKDLIAGVINRQTKCILIDPYANAFNDGPGDSPWKNDVTDMKPELHERKWEIDSLCYPIRLAHGYWKRTEDISVFDEDWKDAMRLILKTFKEQQRKDGPGPYRFMRNTSWSMDSLPLGGYGNPINPVGLIVSSFRPSDDATIFPFLVPSNHFAVVSLKQLVEISNDVLNDKQFSSECLSLAEEVEEALDKYAVAEHLNYEKIYPYEVDGFGNQLFMDDANIPSLLSLPYLNVMDSKEEIYENTRKFILSKNNPYYFEGKASKGIGGPHAGLGKIWHLSIIMQGLTSNNEDEIIDCIKILKETNANTGFMHESFDKNDATNYSRSWFAWANTLFGEFILFVEKQYPHLLQKQF